MTWRSVIAIIPLSSLLADKSFLPCGGILAYPCCHLYHQDARFQRKQRPISRQTATSLKGRDHLVAATALQCGLKVTFLPYMFENCADGTWQLERFPTRDEKRALSSQMDEDDLKGILPICASSEDDGDIGVTWLEDPPTSDKPTGTDAPAAAHLHQCDYCPWGYFGNESSIIDLYTFAAIHIAIPPFGKSPQRSEKPLPAKRKPSPRNSKAGGKKLPKKNSGAFDGVKMPVATYAAATQKMDRR